MKCWKSHREVLKRRVRGEKNYLLCVYSIFVLDVRRRGLDFKPVDFMIRPATGNFYLARDATCPRIHI